MPVIETDDPPATDPATLLHDSHKNAIIVCAIVCVVLATVFVGLRFYTRTRILRVLAPTDWSLLLALGLSVVLSAYSIEEAIHGLGSHVWDFDVEAEYTPLQKSAWFAILFYILALYLIKASILLLYLHIFTSTRTRLVIRLIIALVAIAALWSIAITATSCVPLAAFWDPAKAEGAYCHKTELFWVNTAFHTVTDYLIFAVPLPGIWRMKLPRRQKAVLVGLFSAGFIICFISIVRVILLADLHKKKDPDFAYAGTTMTYLSLVEVNAAIIVACIITLKPLANKYFPSWLNGPVDPGAELTYEKPTTIGGTRPPLTSPSRNSPQGSAPKLESGSSGARAEADWDRLELGGVGGSGSGGVKGGDAASRSGSS